MASMFEKIDIPMIVSAAGAGVGLGILLEKGSLLESRVLRAQAKLRTHVPLRIFWAATATGSIALLVSRSGDVMPPLPAVSFGRHVLGGALMGVGMYISGGTPSTLTAQVGSARPEALFTVPGALIGAIAYGYSEASLSRYFWRTLPWTTLHEVVGSPIWGLTVGFAAIMVGTIYAIEHYVEPWVQEVTGDEEDLAIEEPITVMRMKLSHRTWPTDEIGIMAGLLLLPGYVYRTGPSGLGFTDGFTVIGGFIAKALDPKFPTRSAFSYFSKYLERREAVWALTLDMGLVIGAAVSSLCSGNFFQGKPVSSFSWAERAWLVIGGGLAIFGARLASATLSVDSGGGDFARLGCGAVITITSLTLAGLAAAHLSQFIPGQKTLRSTTAFDQNGEPRPSTSSEQGEK